MTMDEEIMTICKAHDLDEVCVEEIINICTSNFDDTPADQAKRTKQIQKVIQRISEEKFSSQ
jgi:hypothetical protein